MSLDEATGQLFAARVRRRLEQTVRAITVLRLANGETLETTPRHLFMTADGQFLPAAHFKAGLKLKTHEQKLVRVASVNQRNGVAIVNNLVLDAGANYHVGRAGLLTRVVKQFMDVQGVARDVLEIGTPRPQQKRTRKIPPEFRPGGAGPQLPNKSRKVTPKVRPGGARPKSRGKSR